MPRAEFVMPFPPFAKDERENQKILEEMTAM
jgi:hypothetical protein